MSAGTHARVADALARRRRQVDRIGEARVVAVVTNAGDRLPLSPSDIVSLTYGATSVALAWHEIAGDGWNRRRGLVRRIDERHGTEVVVRVAGDVARRVLHVVRVAAELQPRDELVPELSGRELHDQVGLVVERRIGDDAVVAAEADEERIERQHGRVRQVRCRERRVDAGRRYRADVVRPRFARVDAVARILGLIADRHVAA